MSKLAELIRELCPNGVEWKTLGEVLTIKNGRDYKEFDEGDVPVYGSGGIMTYIDTFVYDKPSVLIPRKGSVDKLYYVEKPFWTVDTIFYTEIDTNQAIPKFVFYYLQMQHLEKLNKAGGVPSLTQTILNKVFIPIPPLPVQEEIVRILDIFTELTAELTARRKQYEYYRDLLLNFDKCQTGGGGQNRHSVPVVWKTLGEIGRVSMCKRIMKAETSTTGDVPFFKIGTFGREPDAYITNEKFEEYRKAYSFPRKGEILLSAAGTIGRTVIYDGKPSYYQDSNIVWLENDESKVLNKYLYYFYQTKPWAISEGGTIARLYNDNISKTRIPIPSLSEQARIVSILDRFDALCNDLTSGLPAEIEARKKQYEYYRDKLLTFAEV
ncbi:MAG: restriction endonuclease subunit S [Planctomycetia bacterium]|nr:restriction endonuclease subunit S [Planctomycetia bacterium]